MTYHSIDSHKKRIDDLFEKVTLLSFDLEIQSHWARYLCILVCGFVEVSVNTILDEYTKKHSNSQVADYVHSQLDWFQNPNSTKILNLIGSFNLSWKNSLELSIVDEKKDAIDSIVANKNLISHGITTGISYMRLKGYYDQACKVIDLIKEIVI